ncbi:hypothetical protein INT45_012284 [Circinella minor]|uniref:Sucrase/ferredoxin-like-domain-containing protein n=1 Tax=Circinella minor TaxID=1195481 RepID=A0A8H7S5A7_9FUNG|nr:hypothetical protein INT45_012284 [Circinella minor]
MASLLRKLGNAVGYTSEEPQPPVNIDQIPPSDCIVDGDCSACPAPCDDHKQFPSYLQFDKETPLLGSMKPYGRQVMISTGQVDWAEKIEDDEGTLAANLNSIIKKQYDVNKAGRIFITNTSRLTQQSTIKNGQDVIIIPDNILITNVTPDRAQAFFDKFLNIPIPSFTKEEQKDNSNGHINGHSNVYINGHSTTNGRSNGYINKHAKGSSNGHHRHNNGHAKGQSNGHTNEYAPSPDDMQIIKNTHKAMILICSHKKRDKRCGITAPILGAEFDNVLREKDLTEDDVAIYMVSHVGGHKFAGNVICYIHEGQTGIWYGRVNTCHCRAIIEDTICAGKVIKELYRGAMSHSFGEIKSDRLRW